MPTINFGYFTLVPKKTPQHCIKSHDSFLRCKNNNLVKFAMANFYALTVPNISYEFTEFTKFANPEFPAIIENDTVLGALTSGNCGSTIFARIHHI